MRQEVVLRDVSEQDVMFLFYLANDLECRKSSLNSDKIMLEEHLIWFEQMMKNPMKKQYILVDSCERVGQGRLEQIGNKCRISYSIVPECRGRGYGKVLLRLLEDAACRDFSGCMYVYGEVLEWNISSRRIFEQLGYIGEKKKDYFYFQKAVTD